MANIDELTEKEIFYDKAADFSTNVLKTFQNAKGSMTYEDPLILNLENLKFDNLGVKASHIETLQLVIEHFASKTEKTIFWQVSEEEKKSFITIPEVKDFVEMTFERPTNQMNLEVGILKVHVNYLVEKDSDEELIKGSMKYLLKVINSNDSQITGIIATSGPTPQQYVYLNVGTAKE
jgi:hypothetical protein